MPRLRIIAVNDVYALGNLPRLRGLVVHFSTHDPADATLVTLAGDFVAPSLLSSLDSGRGMVECLNAVGVTHAVLGNHEDDIPTEALADRIRELDAKCLGTNVRNFDPPLPAFDVVDVTAADGTSVRVGLVGVVMDDPNAYRRPPFGGATLESPDVAVLREGARLVAEERCAFVIAITHQALAADRALAHAAGELRLPVILGGHEHQVALEVVAGTHIVKAGADAVTAAIVDVVFEGARADVSVRLERTATFPEDAAVRALVEQHLAAVRTFETTRLVELAPDQELSSIGTRSVQTSMGTFLCSSLRDAFGAQGCVFNGGGIRGMRVYAGALTYGDLQSEVPFDNTIVVVHLPGRVLSDAVAASRSRAPFEFGGFLQVDDRMAVDERGRVTAVDGKPLDPNAEYRIAMVHALFDGLDEIAPLRTFLAEHPALIPSADTGRETKLALIDFLAIALWRRLGAFEAIDTDGDGYATRKEIAAALGESESSLTTRILIDAFDTNRDGVVSREEADAKAPWLKDEPID